MNWEEIKESRFNGLIEQIDFYAWKVESAKLSKEQIKHVKELRQMVGLLENVRKSGSNYVMKY